MNRTTISQIERGEMVPKLDSAVKLAGVLEISLGELTEGIVWESPELAAGRFVLPEPSPDGQSKRRSQSNPSQQP